MMIVKEKSQMNMTSKNIEGIEMINVIFNISICATGADQGLFQRGEGYFYPISQNFLTKRGGPRVRTPLVDIPKCY
jgi:hypothetical protein